MDLKDLEDKISKKTLAVVLSISNTNYGTSDDFKSISNLCYKRKIRCHLDTGRDGMIS
jgi:glutamate/tyrosine decarboxylase-like PLP-dependent enzyme